VADLNFKKTRIPALRDESGKRLAQKTERGHEDGQLLFRSKRYWGFGFRLSGRKTDDEDEHQSRIFPPVLSHAAAAFFPLAAYLVLTVTATAYVQGLAEA
jgi:hypothetical protein